MKSVSYYSEFIPEHNACRNDRYLAVNCTGHAVYSYTPVGKSTRKDYYLIYLVSGSFRFDRPYQSRLMESGDLIIINAFSPFEYTALTPSVDYYWVHFSGREAKALLESLQLETDRFYRVGQHECFFENFLALFLSCSDKSPLAEDLRAKALLSILLDFAKATVKEDVGVSSSALVARSTAYIHEHIAEPLTVADLAAREYLSSGRYRELFRRVIGMSPQEYILRLRINMACDLITNTPLPIAEIALAVGCPDSRYFSRLFMKRVGMSPSDYRKRKQAEA
ncbi:MAG: helix-turn-helix transcriptional regulator [Clostridia bacterium]|nr:helix-turn-helix transcriptional regulator [Clostridia bacterium]